VRSTVEIRTAGVTMVGSRFHYSTWLNSLHTARGIVIALAIVAFISWFVARIVSYRSLQRMRRAQLRERLHRAKPYTPPSIDDEM